MLNGIVQSVVLLSVSMVNVVALHGVNPEAGNPY
jgi:hypothetical protein